MPPRGGGGGPWTAQQQQHPHAPSQFNPPVFDSRSAPMGYASYAPPMMAQYGSSMDQPPYPSISGESPQHHLRTASNFSYGHQSQYSLSSSAGATGSGQAGYSPVYTNAVPPPLPQQGYAIGYANARGAGGGALRADARTFGESETRSSLIDHCGRVGLGLM